MTNKKILTFMTFFLFCLGISQSPAQNLLTKTEIEKYLSSVAGLQSLDAEIEASNENEEEKFQGRILEEPDSLSLTPISDSLEQLIAHPTYDKFTEIITEAGFESPEHWAGTGDRIMIAYGAFQLKNPERNEETDIDEIKKEIQLSLERIEKNKFISNEQKQTLSNKIKNSMALMSDPNYIDNENIPIISPYIDWLNSLFKDYQ